MRYRAQLTIVRSNVVIFGNAGFWSPDAPSHVCAQICFFRTPLNLYCCEPTRLLSPFSAIRSVLQLHLAESMDDRESITTEVRVSGLNSRRYVVWDVDCVCRRGADVAAPLVS